MQQGGSRGAHAADHVGAAAVAGGFGGGDEDDWQLQLALQLSMAEDVHAPPPEVLQATATAAVGEANIESNGRNERRPQQQQQEQWQHHSKQTGPEVAAAGNGAAAVGGDDADSSGQKGIDKNKRAIALAGTSVAAAGDPMPSTSQGNAAVQKTTSKKKRAGGGGSGGGRRRSAGPVLDLCADDLFELYAMFEPGDEGIIDARHVARQMQRLGVPEVDEEMLQEMMDMGVQVQGGSSGTASQGGLGAGGPAGLSRRGQLSLEGFMHLAKQVLGGPQNE